MNGLSVHFRMKSEAEISDNRAIAFLEGMLLVYGSKGVWAQ